MSPRSATPPERPARAEGPASRPGPVVPDVTIPLRFVLTGLLALVVGVVLLVFRPDLLTAYHYHQHTVAVTHLLVLGFLLSIVSGALYQLVPIVLEATLYSERLARWHFVVHLVSVVGMVWMFWVWDMKQVGHFGSGLAVGVGLLLWNLGRTLWRARRWTVVSVGVGSALCWLAAVVGVGLALSAAKSTYELTGRPEIAGWLSVTLAGLQATQAFLARFEPLALMHAHAHLGLLGVFVLLTVVVAYKLVPMFVIGEVQQPWRTWASLGLLNLGTAATFLTVLTQSPLKPLAGLLVAAGLAVYGLELAAIVRARRRLVLDWGLRMFLLAQGLLLPLVLLGLGLSWPGLALTEFTGRLELAYGFLAVFGVIGFSILGMLYKIVPFLVWFAAYSREVGRARTPALHEMYSAPLQAWGCGLWLAGLVVALAGICGGSVELSRLGAVLLMASLGTFVINTARVLHHLFRPRLQPFPASRNRPTPPAASALAATLKTSLMS